MAGEQYFNYDLFMEDCGLHDCHLDLFTAASIGDEEFCMKFVRNYPAISLNVQNKLGWTALMYACYKGHYALVELFISSGCNATLKNYKGETALMLAVKSGDLTTFETILEVSNIEDRDCRGWTAVFYAVYYSREHFTSLLLNNKVNINCVDLKNHTPLMIAVKSGVEGIISLLLKHTLYAHETFCSREQLLALTKNPNIIKAIMDHDKKTKVASNFLSPLPQEAVQSPFASKKPSMFQFRLGKSLSYSPNGLPRGASPKPERAAFEDVERFLGNLGLAKYYSLFRDEEVDLETLLTFNEEHLKEVGIKLLGPRRKIFLAIQRYNNYKKN